VTPAFVWQAQQFQSLAMSFSRVMLENRFQATPRHWNFRCNIHFNQLATRPGSQFQDALDWMLCCNITSISSNSKTLWMLRCNSHFNQLPRRSGCYVVTSISINFEDALDATLQHNIHFKQLQDAVHATFQHPFQSTSRTLWMLRCNIHFNQLRRRSGCYVAA